MGFFRSSKSAADWAWNPILMLLGVFLALFGILNFLELPLGWKDRNDQVARYLGATVGAGPGWVLPVLWAQKSVEGVLGVLALGGLVRRDARLVIAAIVGWMTIMCGFVFMDVWAADRAELQEHTVYFGIFALMLMIVVVLQTMQAVGAHDERRATARDPATAGAPVLTFAETDSRAAPRHAV